MKLFNSIFTPGKEASLDGLRALAILLVLVTHIMQTIPGLSLVYGKVEWATPLFNGWIGVDLFFVLSGFLVGGQVIRAIQNKHFSFTQFYLRRIFRIAPAYFSVITLIALAWYLFPSAQPYLSPIEISKSALIKNFLFITDYFPTNIGIGSWSLSIEEQFYIVIPIVLTLLARYRKNKEFIIFLSIIPICLILRMFTYRYFDIGPGASTQTLFNLIYFPLHTRMDALAAGVCTFMLYQMEFSKVALPLIAAYLRFIGLMFVGFVLLTGALAGGWFETTLQYTIVALGFSFLLLGVLGDQRSTLTRLLSMAIWTPVARLSYSIYLTHILVIRIIQHVFESYNSHYLAALLMFFMSIIIAIPLYILIENPMHKFAQRNYVLTTQK